MFAIGNDEINKSPILDGKSTICHICGQEHDLEYGVNTETGLKTDVAFIQCPQTGSSYLVGIKGKDIRCKFR